MPARYSSEGSLTDAEALAKNLGIRYELLPIEPMFQSVEKPVKKYLCEFETRPNGGKFTIAPARNYADGAVEQIQRPGFDHRQ